MKFDHPLVSSLYNTITENRLIKPGEKILVGVSGGPDSVALLHLLNALRSTSGFQMVVAHFNHRLRPSAGPDQTFVENLARSLNLEYISEKRAAAGRPQAGSLEDWARKWRFAFFRKAAKRCQTNKLFLAHTQDDLAETVLMRLIRGAGLTGLRGILPDNEVDGLRILRPLIHVSKTELVSFLKQKRYEYRLDPTNQNSDLFRNQTRLRILPYLESVNPNIKQLLVQLSFQADTDYDFLQKEADKIFKRTFVTILGNEVRFKRSPFEALHPAMQRMLIRKAYQHVQGHLRKVAFKNFIELERLIHHLPPGKSVPFPGGVLMTKEKEFYRVIRKMLC